MSKNKENLIKNLEYLRNQILEGKDVFTEVGLKNVLDDIKAVVYACPEKIANAVLEEVD